VCAVVLATAPAAVAGQRLTATEWSLGSATASARRSFVGVEGGVAYRPGGQGRFAVSAAGGSVAGKAAIRAQLTWQFLLTPAARRGTGLYAGVGGALAVSRRTPGAGYLAIVMGLEAAPGRAGNGLRNWYVELGLGGGVRAAAGWRWRSFPAWWINR
jgi:hypothetical protein